MAHAAQPVSLAHAHNSTRLRDSVRQATSQVQRRSRDVGGSPERPCLARGDCCPPGKGCNRACPSSRDEAGVLQPLLHRTQERWWPSANPGSASLEPGFTQAPVQDAEAQAHDQMHSAPGLVCSDRPEGRLLSRFDPSATQTVSTVCVRRSGMAVQGPSLRALPVSPCVHEGCRGRPYPVTGSGRQDPQLPRRLAYSSPIQRAVGRSLGLGAPAPQPVEASGQLGKEQALPCAENLFSRCGVRLGEYDGTPHGGTCPSSAELPEFLQRQKCGTTETVSEAPGAYGIRSCSHAARIASYETTSALATLPGPEVGMAPRYTASRYLPAMSAISHLPRSGGEPASTALGGGRSSLSVAVSRKSIAHIRDPHPERQKLRAALCLPRRAAEREGCLQTEVGPLDSGGRRLGVPVARRAMPPGGEGSLHQECCLLPCVGARCLFGRHLQSCGLGDTEHLRKILQSSR